MKYLRYYFKFEFVWDNKWENIDGYRTLVVSASHEVLMKEYVDYSILIGLFLHTNALREYESANKFIENLKKELYENGVTYYGNEIVGLELKKDFSRPFDNLGTEDGIDGPLNWNIATPIHLQYIPTTEIFQLFDDWLRFLKEVEENPPRFLNQ